MSAWLLCGLSVQWVYHSLHHLHSEWSFNNLVIFLHSSSHSVTKSLFVCFWPWRALRLCVITYNSCLEIWHDYCNNWLMLWDEVSGDLCGALPHKYWVDSNDFHHSQCLNSSVLAIESKLSLDRSRAWVDMHLREQLKVWLFDVRFYIWLQLLMFSLIRCIMLEGSYLKLNMMVIKRAFKASSLVTSFDACLTS
jgi:hypothetical protein